MDVLHLCLDCHSLETVGSVEDHTLCLRGYDSLYWHILSHARYGTDTLWRSNGVPALGIGSIGQEGVLGGDGTDVCRRIVPLFKLCLPALAGGWQYASH